MLRIFCIRRPKIENTRKWLAGRTHGSGLSAEKPQEPERKCNDDCIWKTWKAQ